MNRRIQFLILLLIIFVSSCKKDISTTELQGYPANVGEIIVKKCATSGCHIESSKAAAGGLALETWDKLFEGGSAGSVVIPYSSEQSWLSYFINTFSDLGISLTPTMPINSDKLSYKEVELLQQWINNGAPSANGKIAFADDPNRNKFYVTNQGCDIVTVFDTKSKLAMRYIKVGVSENIETPHNIKVSPDGKYWYVIFATGNVIQKFRTADDSFVGSIEISQGSWNTFTISNDGKFAYIVDFSNNGRIAYVDLENLTLIKTISAASILFTPHGITTTADFKTLYITNQYGNYIYKIDVSNILLPEISTVIIVPGQPQSDVHDIYDPHEVALSPDGTKYFVSCQASNEVRVFKQSNDSLLAVIPVGVFPLEFSFSKSHSYLFVSCEYDQSQINFKGAVYVIDYNTFQVVKILNENLFEPHGIAVDEKNNLLIIANRNVSPNGPAPHHTSVCGGRNGYIRLVDLNSLEFIKSFRSEVSTDPYQIAVKN